MTDIANNPAQGAQGQGTATPAAPAQGAPPAAPAPGLDFQRMSAEQFNARLQAERDAATRAALTTLGVDSLDTAKARVAKAAELERASLTESEKAAARIKELEPAAAKASALEAVVQRQLKAAEGAVPEAKRGLLKLAPPESDPVARLDWITNARAEGLFAEASPATPANTKPGNGPPPTPASGQKPLDQMTPAERDAAWKAHLAGLHR